MSPLPARPTLTVLLGPPGAGKTTWAAANQQPGQVLCSTERLRTDPTLTARPGALIAYLTGLRVKAHRALAGGQDVLVDACNTRTEERSVWLAIAREHHARTHLVVLDTPMGVLMGVQRTRGHPVAEAKMRRYQAEYQRAMINVRREGWSRITHIRRVVVPPRRSPPNEVVPEPGSSLQPRHVSSW